MMSDGNFEALRMQLGPAERRRPKGGNFVNNCRQSYSLIEVVQKNMHNVIKYVDITLKSLYINHV